MSPDRSRRYGQSGMSRRSQQEKLDELLTTKPENPLTNMLSARKRPMGSADDMTWISTSEQADPKGGKDTRLLSARERGGGITLITLVATAKLIFALRKGREQGSRALNVESLHSGTIALQAVLNAPGAHMRAIREI
ncbi:hypothetical protein BKA70DRAFT_1220047 [Coprinopsis sp. MPI-PUGE-AT-0042]|nr:hypothetical protein BKA70DRAFT_1220047 [Coprinopsis sp. MPI-PUGE-AT-0042]